MGNISNAWCLGIFPDLINDNDDLGKYVLNIHLEFTALNINVSLETSKKVTKCIYSSSSSILRDFPTNTPLYHIPEGKILLFSTRFI